MFCVVIYIQRKTGVKMSENIRYGIFSILVAGIIAYLSWDFLPALSWGAILAISLFSVHKTLSLYIKPWMSTAFLTFALLSLVIAPLGYIGIKAAQELPDAKSSFISFQENGIHIPEKLTENSFLWEKISPKLIKSGLVSNTDQTKIVLPENVSTKVSPILNKDHDKIVRTTLEISKHTSHLIELTMFTLISFAIFIAGGDELSKQIDKVASTVIGGSGPSHVHQLTRAIRGTVTGIVLVGIIQGLAIAVPLVVFHCPHPALFTLIIIVSSLIPFCSPVALLLAALVTLVSHGAASAIVIAVFGIVVIFAADHIIKPKLVGHSTELGFLPSMISILGTLKVLGLIGLFVGPALFSVAATIWKEFSSENS